MDYKLINALLEDESEASLLKLKMIIDSNCKIDFDKINEEKIIVFINNCKTVCENIFRNDPICIQNIRFEIQNEIYNLYYDSFLFGFKNNMMAMTRYNSKNKFKVMKIFQKVYEEVETFYEIINSLSNVKYESFED